MNFVKNLNHQQFSKILIHKMAFFDFSIKLKNTVFNFYFQDDTLYIYV